MLLLYLMDVPEMLGYVPPRLSGGEYQPTAYYLSYTYEEQLAIEREKCKRPEVVKQAAVQAVTQNYYAPKSKINTDGLKILKNIASDLEIELDKCDKLLLKMEIKHILALRDLDDEETILLL